MLLLSGRNLDFLGNNFVAERLRVEDSRDCFVAFVHAKLYVYCRCINSRCIPILGLIFYLSCTASIARLRTWAVHWYQTKCNHYYPFWVCNSAPTVWAAYVAVFIYHTFPHNFFFSVIESTNSSNPLSFYHFLQTFVMARSYYLYDPSVPIAAVAAVLFTLACLVGAFQTIRYKSTVWWVMILAAACEAAGFITRVPSASEPTSRTIFTISFTLIVLAPVLMAAACYVCFVSWKVSSICVPS